MFRDHRFHQPGDGLSCGKSDLQKSHTRDAQVVFPLTGGPGDPHGEVDLILPLCEVENAAIALVSDHAAEPAGTAQAEISNREIAFGTIDFQLGRVVKGNAPMHSAFAMALFEENIGENEANRIVGR